MATHFMRAVRHFVCLIAVTIIAVTMQPKLLQAAPFAAIVQDARSGEVLYANNANTRLHPASLTKMLTLYITFQELQRGNLSLDTMVTVSPYAAKQPPSRLGLKAGQKIAVRYLIRAAAIKSANDAAQALSDHIGGNKEKFAKRMTATAKSLGMRNSTFKNGNGLTEAGHLSTAADMNLLGMRLFYDFPQFYSVFSRRTADAGIAQVRTTNSRFLDAYEGADGIKTGYTVAAGFNLTASAQRGNVRIIATVFGGTSTAQRNAKMKELMDLGFKKAPANAKGRGPGKAPAPTEDMLIVEAPAQRQRQQPDQKPAQQQPPQQQLAMAAAVAGPAPSSSRRPAQRPNAAQPQQVAALEPAPRPSAKAAIPFNTESVAAAIAEAPPPRPAQAAPPPPPSPPPAGTLDAQAFTLAEGGPQGAVEQPTLQLASTAPVPKRRTPNYDAPAKAQTAEAQAEAEPVVIRLSTSNARHWGVNLGSFASRAAAEKVLLKTQLSESASLSEGLRKVVQRPTGYEANFLGLTQEQADLACRRLAARSQQCFTMAP